MDKFRLSTDLSEPFDGVNIYINDRNLIDILKEVELPFAKKEGAPQIAGSYEGLSGDIIFLPSKHLLGKPYKKYDWYDGKVVIYVCGECSEEGCWSFLIKNTIEKDKVIWSEFEQPHRPLGSDGEWKYDSIEPFVFDKKQYESELKKRYKDREKYGHYNRYIELQIPYNEAYNLSLAAVNQIKNCKIYDQASAFGWIRAKTIKKPSKKGQLIFIEITKVDKDNSVVEVSCKPIDSENNYDSKGNLKVVENIIEFLKEKSKNNHM